MLTCPNCGGENRYGAIFCRSCGKKLDIIDELTVENIHEKTGGKKRRRKKEKSELTPKQLRRRSMIINGIRVAVILLVGFAVYLTQQTPSLSAISTSDGSRRSFMKKKQTLRRGSPVTVTTKEINSYLAGLLPRIKDGKVVKFDYLQVALGNDANKDNNEGKGKGKDKDKNNNEIAIRMYVRVFGKNMLFQLFGKLEKSNGKVRFSPTTFAKIGKLPYPTFLMKQHCKNILSDLKSDKELFEKLSEATIKEVKIRGGGKTTAIALKTGGKS